MRRASAFYLLLGFKKRQMCNQMTAWFLDNFAFLQSKLTHLAQVALKSLSQNDRLCNPSFKSVFGQCLYSKKKTKKNSK